MKKYFVTFATICTLVTICTFVTFVAYAGIQNTKHDLSVGGPGPIKATDVTEKCVFCHTPHASSGSYPLWNHKLSEATYTVLGPPGPLESRLTTPGQPDGSSKLCFGCHDGTVAIGLVLNTPGRGSIYPSALSMGGVSGITAECPTGGCMPTDAETGYIGTILTFGPFPTGQHLVSIEYDSGLAAAKVQQCINGEATIGLVDPETIPSNDPVQLRATSHANAYSPDTGKGIQCRTCHDPHDNTIKCFLVKGNCTTCPCTPGGDWDALCTTCHYTCP